MATGRVSDAAVVGVPHPSSGSAIAIAVVPQESVKDLASLSDELTRAIVAGHGTPFRPVRTLFVSELPKTRNMKTMRRLIRSALTGEPTGDLSALVNPEAFDELKAKVQQQA
jgi:acetyl-CoA synthetase